jgi:lysophospholipase L1-like esterase
MNTLRSRYLLLLLALAAIAAIDFAAGLLIIPKPYNSFRSPHDYYHHGLLPKRSALSRWGDNEYPVLTNSLGLRDSSLRDVPLRPDRRRILLIGDSFTEGIGMPYEETFAGLLQESMDADILDAGVVGYSPKLYYLKVEYLLKQVGLGFHELVVFIDISDTLNEIEYEEYTPEQQGRASRLLRQVRMFLRDHSATGYLVDRLLTTQKEHARQAVLSGVTPCWGGEHPEIYDSDREGAWTLDEGIFEQFGRKGLALAEQNMQRLVDLCRQNAIRVTVVVYPWPVQIKFYDRDSIQVRFWRDFSRKNGISFVDLFPDFIDDKRYSGFDEVYGKFFIPGDVHWNAAGHRLVAERVRETLGNEPRPARPHQGKNPP